MKKGKRILITDPIHPEAVARLKEAGFDVDELPEEQRPNLASHIEPYHAVICRTSTPIDKTVLDAAKNLSCIALASTGFDRIDAKEALRRNISILGLPSYDPTIDPEHDGNFVSTAEHTLLLMLAAVGDFYHAYQSMKEGRWEKKHLVGNELAGKTVGILGLGRIGTLVARRLSAFRARIIAYDTYVSAEKAASLGVELVSLEEFCHNSDIITIHMPKTVETEGMLGAKEFDLMKDGVFIVNTARAAIMDEGALIRALDSGKVKRAAIDVFHDEPDGLNWGLVKHPSIIATPHIGGSTHEAWLRISLSAADNIISFFQGEVRHRLNPPTKAIILAAGKGTRLHPLTISKPKGLLEVGSKTILEHQIEGLIAAGIKEVVLVVGFEKEAIQKYLASKRYPIKITYVDNAEYETSHPIKSLWFAREHLNEPVIFAHCDVLFGREAIASLLAHTHDSVMPYRDGSWDAEAGKIIVDQDGNVRELGKHIPQKNATGEYLQFAKFGQKFVERLRNVLEQRLESSKDSYTIDAFNDVARAGDIRVIGVPFTGTVLEIDTPEDYEAAKRSWKE